MRKIDNRTLAQMGLNPDLPKHVAIIMDGNGRWASKKLLPRTYGHREGMERLTGLVRFVSDIGIESLTLYAFSTENWKRPQHEIDALFGLLIEYFDKQIAELHKNGVRITLLGDDVRFSEEVRQAIRNATTITKGNRGLKLNLALNYGSRAEILRAAKSIVEDVNRGILLPENIDEHEFESRLYTSNLPQVDLVIRTGGEQRLSNFLLYQAAYAELIFVKDYWPDFSDDRFIEVLREFQNRNRRYGGL
ncbi:MAG: Ditrans,polycis-undecaprenyl-diphosphate synthase ((2E,6E)-farnesyl-diphosphate specific) [Firmicutes bacterium ADurb.Bin182]|nr:MAG: Ditrans,polycis-undecaprenyl-diphosphate synthase ((2E,6E)-farnesyl-diphosphate specific) [Firmicutes bacterium ADurb.Bin182]